MMKETTQACKPYFGKRRTEWGWLGEENRCRDCGGIGISTPTTLNS